MAGSDSTDIIFDTSYVGDGSRVVIVRPGATRVAWRVLCLNALLFRQAIEYEGPADNLALYERLTEWIASHLGSHLSELERQALAQPLHDWSDGLIIDASWRSEALAVLLFALGHIESLPPFDAKVDLTLDVVPILEPPESFIFAARLRDFGEIEEFHQRAELWLWRMRSRPRKGKLILPLNVREALGGMPGLVEGDLSAFDKPVFRLGQDEARTVESIALERLYAARWLSGTMQLEGEDPEQLLDWDRVSTDT